jgi:hypothetical protein
MLPGARSWWRRMGFVDGWPLATPDTEQREKAARCGSHLAEAARDVHSSWGAEATGPSPVSAVAGCPGEQQRGKADCRAWCLGLRPGAPQAAHPRGATSNLEISPARKRRWPTPANDSYLVDSASSHMLVSKIKPCMSKYKQLYGETANGSLYKLSFI